MNYTLTCRLNLNRVFHTGLQPLPAPPPHTHVNMTSHSSVSGGTQSTKLTTCIGDTYDECEHQRADTIADVWRDVVGELLNGRQEALQLVELTLHGACVTAAAAAATARRRGGRRGRHDGGAAARRPRLAARRTRR